MANIFTKSSKLPRTTTLSDFADPARIRGRFQNAYERSKPRILSPTRRHNTQSSGLSYQSAYNRHNELFCIWHPNQSAFQRRYGTQFPHLKHTNFSCKHCPTTLKTRTDGLHYRPRPTIKYCLDTVQRRSFQTPKSLLEN